MSTIAERVAAGAAFLDEREPGWWERIDLDRLDLRAPCRCILGQLAEVTAWGSMTSGTWSLTVRHFGLRRFGLRRWRAYDDDDLLVGTDAAFGFNAAGPQDQEAYDALTAEWARVIAERRAASGGES